MEGVIRVPLAPLRSEPSDQSEMVTQALFGERLRLLDEGQASPWVFIELEADGYRGHVDRKLVDTSDEAVSVFREGCVRLVKPLTPVEWMGETVYLPAGSRIPKAAWPGIEHRPPSNVVDAARLFMGAPYLWGGKSILGMDCSGLTQLAGALCGMDIPRDASQQWAASPHHRDGWGDLQHGDMVFFHKPMEDAVTHVGMALDSGAESWTVLHASGEVRIDPLTPDGILRQGQLTHLWTGAAGWGVSAG